MPIVRSRSWVPASPDTVFAFFDDPANLSRLMPPPVAIRLVRVEPAPPQTGSHIEFRYGLGPAQGSWIIRLVDRLPNERIADETISGPMARFHHSHTFTPSRGGGTWIEDRIDFRVGPKGVLGSFADRAAAVAIRLLLVWRAAMQRRILR
jgi:ligand-binding SRPBCC domain-containing protein